MRQGRGDCVRGNHRISEERNGSRDRGVPAAVFMCARHEQQPNDGKTNTMHLAVGNVAVGKGGHREA